MRRKKRDGCIDSALGAFDSHLNSWFAAVGAHHAEKGIESFVLLDFAGLAALGRIFEPFVRKKELFPGCEDKLTTTFDAVEGLVNIFLYIFHDSIFSSEVVVLYAFGRERSGMVAANRQARALD